MKFKEESAAALEPVIFRFALAQNFYRLRVNAEVAAGIFRRRFATHHVNFGPTSVGLLPFRTDWHAQR